ncbi:hypothetical protein BUALT_Bualt08G0035800 [Buddleja alternifolia]|uniref:Uncharacterized protein n=1 Tax=Buddleja alternifolia TaxID=168488 RepID=A0AAV6X7F2_9LAMI|nr:hypothetical protein BUALT_Bualt08G0035800 [Buddleja alternifolia]
MPYSLKIYGWERLTPQEEKDKLLAHHPHSEDKIGCGLDSIMVDRHPRLKHSRCLFVVRTDGGWIDFSYQKCPLELTYVISTLLKQKDL